MLRLSTSAKLEILAVLTLAVGALPSAVSAQTATALVEDFTEEKVGTAPTSFSTPIGFWSIGTDGVDTKPLLFEDGTQFASSAANTTTQAGNALAAQAQGLNTHQFSDASAALAYFPIAVFKGVPNFNQGTVVTRFAIVGGDLDTEAGIIFNYQPNGDFLTLRLDADESSLELYSFTQGQQIALSIIENVPSALARWHDLQLTVTNPSAGTHVAGLVDGQKYLDVDLTGPISGQVGTLSKTDTVVVFNSFAVDPNGQ
jgi:hypothetical protein